MLSPRSRFATVLTGALALSILVGAPAEARRGGSFGSRGARTYNAPPPTQTTPGYTAPVQRSMTTPPAGAQATRPNAATPGAPAPAPRRPGMFGGLGGGLLAGLVTGGLIGALLGHGFGGFGGLGAMGGIFAALLQGALLAGAVMLAIRLFRRRSPAAAPAGAYAYAGGPGYDAGGAARPQWSSGGASPAPQDTGVDIPVTAADRETFQRMLSEVQEAFSRENYGALRELTTPEVMSYLAEELSQNATQGRRNEVSNTKLLSADIAEAWREGDAEYATAALNYESIDVMRDRTTGRVVEGDPDRPTATTEVWTFTRRNGGQWKLSAIQA
ncbi:TIM44-like domain-containing protein [Phenylobacterium sp. LjRoot219]|uniref:Tim44 domain-containing protein n=1 Tax=Phenylobacterium sp. LjRoot219 TaxID=3342283 RepID=UPI003ECEC96A